MAIGHAFTVIGWFELPEEDRPSDRIWLDDEALEAHFEAVEQRRSSSSGGEAVPAADMDQNELTAQIRR